MTVQPYKGRWLTVQLVPRQNNALMILYQLTFDLADLSAVNELIGLFYN